MSLYRRGKRGLFWYEFEFGGRRYRGSTGTKQRRSAERIEADARAKVTLGVRDIGTQGPTMFSAVAGEFRELAEQKARGVYPTNVLYQLAFWETVFADVSVDEVKLPAIEAAIKMRRRAPSAERAGDGAAGRKLRPSVESHTLACAGAGVHRGCETLRSGNSAAR
ncbi:MAG: hypothetical protein AB1714_07395 [Acidobacteriota bacterium]